MPDADFPWWYPRKTHQAWSRVRAKGAARFILVNGMAWYGGLMFLIIGLLAPLARHAGQLPAPTQIALNALVWAMAGLTWGALIWHLSERNFRKYAARTGTMKP